MQQKAGLAGFRRMASAGLICALAGAGALGARAPHDATLDEVNQRWSGARCRILFDLEIKKGRDADGWSKSEWIVPGQDRQVRKGNTASQIRVSDRNLLPGSVIRAGSTFVAEGWSWEKPEQEEGLVLHLRLEGSPLRARMNFYGTFYKDMDRDDLGPIERWVRLDIFEVEAANERLADSADPEVAADAAAAGLGSPTAAAAAPPRPPRTEARALVLGVATEPLAVAAGAEAALIVTYEVTGLAPGQTAEVAERRTILRDGEILTALSATVERQAGIHRSTQKLVIPAGLAAGVLELQVTVKTGGAETSGRTLFEVSKP